MDQISKNTRTRAGLPALEALRTMGRLTASGCEDQAIDLAYDLYRTSRYLLTCVWNELEKTAVLEIGMGDPYALSYILQMRDICYDCEDYSPEIGAMPALCFIHAIRYLCACETKPGAARALERIRQDYEQGRYAVVPEFAYDHHNHCGRDLGHNPLDFLEPEGGSKVVPELSMALPYKKKLREILTPIYGGEHPRQFTASMYNHFYEMESPNGLNLEVVQSAFQKSIRRRLEEEAQTLTYEAFLSGAEMEEYLWQRIVIMSVEDIGMGDPWCGRLMYDYYRSRNHFKEEEEIRLLFLLQAVTYLCSCDKERGTEMRKGILVQEFGAGKVPDLTCVP